MAVTTTQTNKPFSPRGNDQSPLAYNRAKLFSGKALDFDGVNDFANVVYSDTIGSVWTWSSIIEADALSGYQAIFGGTFGANNGLIVLKNNQLNIYTNTDNLFSYILETGKKYHVALSQSGSSVSAFINGVLVDSVSLSVTLEAGGGSYYIGRNPYSAIEFFNGKMSGVKLFNTALTAAQVADLYNNPEKVVPTGVDNTALKLWLPMQEGAGTTAINGASDALGSEQIENGDFATDSDWTKGSGWTISGGTANCNSGSSTELYQSSAVSGKTYKITFTITSYTSGNIAARAGGVTGVVRTSTGTFTDTIVANGTQLGVFNSGGFVGSIDNVSAKEISGLGTISGATWTHGIGAPVAQTAVINWNKVNVGANAVLIPQGLTSGRDLLGNLFENVRKQGALNLDGNSWAEVHDNASLDITSAITLECWFYDTDSGAFEGVIGKWKDSTERTYAIIKNNGSNNFLIRISTDGSAQAGPTITNTDYGWIHLVLTYDGASVKGYKNGVYQSQAALTGSIATNDNPVEIGRYGQSTGSQYNNQIAQPRIYNRALTAEEVQRNYNAGKNTYTN